MQPPQLPSCAPPLAMAAVFPELRCHRALSLHLQAKRRLCWVLQEAELTWRLTCTCPQLTDYRLFRATRGEGKAGGGRESSQSPRFLLTLGTSRKLGGPSSCPVATRPLSLSCKSDTACRWLSAKAIPSPAARGLAARGCRLAALPPAGGVRPQGLTRAVASVTRPLQSGGSSSPLHSQLRE